MGRVPAIQHEDLCFNPQHSSKKLGYTPSAEGLCGRNRRILRACWPDSLAKSVSSDSLRDHVSKKKMETQLALVNHKAKPKPKQDMKVEWEFEGWGSRESVEVSMTMYYTPV